MGLYRPISNKQRRATVYIVRTILSLIPECFRFIPPGSCQCKTGFKESEIESDTKAEFDIMHKDRTQNHVLALNFQNYM